MAPKVDKAKKEAQAAKAKQKQKVGRVLGSRQAGGICCDSNSATQGTMIMCVCLQAAEDKTFGLKNKNKSAKVQK